MSCTFLRQGRETGRTQSDGEPLKLGEIKSFAVPRGMRFNFDYF